jgi:hypothetical protein
MAVCTLGSSAAVAVCPDTADYPMNGCTLPGLVGGSFPYFEQSVYITRKNKKNGNFRLSASYGGVASDTSRFVLDQDTSYTIDNTFYQLKAKYNSSREELTGSIRIMGTLPEMTAKQTLMTADLTGVWNSSGNLIGFNTTNIQCNTAINGIAPCTSAEVVYLTLNGPLGEGRKTSTTGLAITSVPVPASVWLFGSGLVGLAGVARRKHV